MTHHVPDWHGVQIYYYEEDKDGLILDCVRPLFERLRPEVEQLCFTRHWRRGPHLRLGILTTGKTFRDVVRPEVETTVGRYLATHPSTARVDEEKLLAVHRQLALEEHERGPLVPFYPDNSIQYDPFDRRIDVLGSEAAARLLERFYDETNQVAFEMLDHVRRGHSRLTVALDLMFATAHAMWPDIRRGFISYRSHAEGFIVRASNPEGRRARCEETYRSRSAALKQRLTAILEILDSGSRDNRRGEVPFIVEWVAIMERFRALVEPLIAAGDISFSAGEAQQENRTWDPELLRHSTFHRLLQSNSARLTFMREDLGFLCYRWMLNLLYLHLNRIGIRPVERFMLCYLAASTVEDLFGISANDFVAAEPGR